MNEPSISVIIPVYKVEDYIGECLRSVMAQTFTDFECILVNDCTPDRSIEVARQLISDYRGPAEFRIVEREANGGLSAARNTGIRAARGRYVYFLDSDDMIAPDCLAALHARAVQYPAAQIITGSIQSFPQKGLCSYLELDNYDFPEYSDDRAWVRSVFLTTFPVIACNKLISRDFITAHNLYFREGILHEDNHWQAQVYHHIEAVAFVNRVTYLYRKLRPGAITNAPGMVKKRLENLSLIYDEMFAKPIKWDRGWAKWVCSQCCAFKYSQLYSSERAFALAKVHSLARVVAKNSSTPLMMRLLFLFWSLPQHRGQDRIFFGLFYRSLKFLPNVN